MTKNVTNSNGRPSYSSLEKERREAARRLKERDEIREEFFEQLRLPAEDMKPLSARAEEVLAIANQRRKICQDIDDVDGRIRLGAKQDADPKELKALKKERTRLYDHLNAFPELGYTREEWEQVDPSLKEKEIGRPKLRIEQRLNRALAAYAEAEQNVRKLEKEHDAPPADLEAYINAVEQPGVGRPRLDTLAKMDRRILKIDDEIAYITSGRAKQEQDEAIQKRMERLGINDPAKLPGRPMTNLSAKLAKLKQEKRKLRKTLARQEKNLDDISRAEREVSKRQLEYKLAKRERDKAPEKDQAELQQKVDAQGARLASAKAELARVRNLQQVVQASKAEAASSQAGAKKAPTASQTASAPKEATSSQASLGLLDEVLSTESAQPSSRAPAVAKTETPKEATPAVASAQPKAAQPGRSTKVRKESREHHRARLEREREELSSVLDEMLAQAGISTRQEEVQPKRQGVSLLDKLAQVRLSNG